jgi:endonuclease/exonuclease/phosphatase family metal-dependent hydrolase
MRRLVVGVVVAALVGLFALTGLRFVDTSRPWLIMGAAFASYAVVGFVVTLLVSLLLLRGEGPRRWAVALGLLSTLGIAVHVCWLAPLYVGGGARGDLVVMSANLELGHGDPAKVVRTATAHDVDVLVLQEVTPKEATALDRAGVFRSLPHHVGQPAPGAEGTMVFSRYSLDEGEPLRLGHGGLDVRVQADRRPGGLERSFRLLAVHAHQPVKSPGGWRRDLGVLRERTLEAVHQGPTLVVGDLNATTDHVLLREILGEGVRDATEQAGSGWQPTWPSYWGDSSPWPLLALDHVLTSAGFTAVRTSTVEVPHTDHLALVVDIATGSRD